MRKLATEVKYIEECLSKSDPALEIEMTINAPIHDEVPAGFVEAETTIDSQDLYRKVLDAKNGKPTKTIVLYIPW